jgi:glycosyltransferase involved in cell wall biosynthesis
MHHAACDTKRVAIVCPLYERGGMQESVYALARGLNRRGIIPDVLWDVEPNWSLLANARANVKYRHIKFRIPTSVISKLPYSFRILARLLNAIDANTFLNDYGFFYSFHNGFIIPKDVQHVYHIATPPLTLDVSNRRSAIRHMPIKFFRWLYKNFLFKISPVHTIHKERNYTTNSEYSASFFQDEYGLNIPVIYPPIDFSGQHFTDNDLNTRDSLVFFSRIVDYKRPQLILDLAQRYPHLRCVIMGAVSQRRRAYYLWLHKRAEEMGIENVIFLPNPSIQKVREELGRAKFYVFPGINEHFGMTTVEAIIAGAIPFVHNSGGQKEIVIEESARFTDAEFFTKFDILLNIPDQELNDIRKRLLDHVSQFSEENFVSKLLSYLDQST